MDKKQMKETAKSVFERYTDKDKVFVTSDGQAFFDESNAKNHAVKNRTGKELALESFLRSELAVVKTAKPKSAASKSSMPAPTSSAESGSSEVNPTSAVTDTAADTVVSEPKTAKTLIANVAEMTTPDDVEAVLETEKAGDNRTTVITACEKRIGELKASKA